MVHKVFVNVIQILVCLILLSAFGPLSFHVGGVIPLSLQTFFVILPAVLFRWPIATAIVMLYLLAGIAGIPVFAGYSYGMEKITGISGGYLISFLLAAALTAITAQHTNRNKFLVHLLLWLGAHVFIISVGLAWQLDVSGDVLANQLPLLKKFVIGSCLKSLAGAVLTYGLYSSPRWRQRLSIP